MLLECVGKCPFHFLSFFFETINNENQLLSVILLLINIAEPNPTENDPFSSIIILNLDRRPDRWEQTRNELVLANVESFERLSAVDV